MTYVVLTFVGEIIGFVFSIDIYLLKVKHLESNESEPTQVTVTDICALPNSSLAAVSIQRQVCFVLACIRFFQDIKCLITSTYVKTQFSRNSIATL